MSIDIAGNATVTDFGIALVTSRPARELLGSTTGTPHYMSPEQSLGEPVDGRSDVYALGVVLYAESNVSFQPLPRGGSAGGLVNVKRKGAAPDTLYQDLSSREVMRLLNEITTWQRAQNARDSTSN